MLSRCAVPSGPYRLTGRVSLLKLATIFWPVVVENGVARIWLMTSWAA